MFFSDCSSHAAVSEAYSLKSFLLLWYVYFWLSHFLQDAFPVRDELLSDLSDDDMQLATVPEPLKPTVISFKQKDDTDLFGLGIQDEAPVAKDSSEELEGKSRNITWCVILTAVINSDLIPYSVSGAVGFKTIKIQFCLFSVPSMSNSHLLN